MPIAKYISVIEVTNYRTYSCSHEDISFNIICLHMLEGGIKQFYLLRWFKKNRLETPFKRR